MIVPNREWRLSSVCGVLAAAALLLLPLSAAATPDQALAASRAWRAEHGAAILRGFAELLALPNVAADLPNVRANAEAIATRLRRRGAEVELLALADTPEAPPVVWGRLAANAAGAADGAAGGSAGRAGARRTLVLYAHYDGQPVDPAEWTFPPWQPTLTTGLLQDGGEPRPLPEPGEAIDPEWRLYARSAADDKAPIAALLAALDALAAAGVPRTADLLFFFEGEEEAGSPHLERFVDRHAERLAADAWIFLDGPVHQTGRPQLFFGVRGYAGFELTVYGAERQLHSGHYGNFAPNPVEALARLVASFEDEAGRVAIDGFYDTGEPLGEEERQALAAIPPFEEALRDELGIARSEGQGAGETGGGRYAERMALPALNARGIAAGAVGAKAVNAIPPSATASFDLRLVAGNDPAAMLDLVAAHVRRQGYHVIAGEPTREQRRVHPKLVRMVRQAGYPAVRTAMDLPIARTVTAAAEAAAGEPVIRMPNLGGSLPLYVFQQRLGTPLVGIPIANHDNNQHAPDENLRLANLWYGMDVLAALLAAP
ncbi:MAG TPA: M20/M25/M40 family metallo-hydrolase [Thermoanaerobaculia bacterium]|nr:M20/M25/M40 family metallo-hydrolase [Thermoanaerobaculia bacterium]